MAVQLTPPTKNVFYLSIILGVLSIVLYLLGLSGAVGGASRPCHIMRSGWPCWLGSL
jgi:hypothetical protein